MPKLSLCMIVRNEAAGVDRCLASVKGLVDEIIVVDTGSDDGTVEVCRGHGAVVHHFPWRDDFSAARNVGLEKATGDWVLVLDADDELFAADRPRVRELLTVVGVDAYLFRTVSYLGDKPGGDVVVCPHVRLFRNRPTFRYVGVIHERVNIPPGARLAWRDITVLHYGYLTPAIQRQDKVRRNLRICEAAVRAGPGDAFAHFNLGTEHLRSGNYLKALASFRRAHRLVEAESGWAPELIKKLAFCLIRLRRHREAEVVLVKGLASYPDYTDLVFLKAGLHQERGEYAQAAREFRRCLKLGEAPFMYPTDLGMGTFKAAFGLGYALQATGSDLKAAAAYRLSLKLNPRSSLALPFLVTALAAAIGPDQARERLRSTFEGTPLVLMAMAQAFAHGGFYRQALAYLADLESLLSPEAPPGSPPTPDGTLTPAGSLIRLVKGLCLLGTRQPEAARTELIAVRAGSAEYPQAVLGLCLCAWVLDRPLEAARLLSRLTISETKDGSPPVIGRAKLAALRGFSRMLLDRGRSTDRSPKKRPAGRKPSNRGGARREALLDLAERLIELGCPDKARPALAMACPAGPDLEAATRVGRALARHGYLALARELLNSDPGWPSQARQADHGFLRVLAGVELKTGHLCRAARLYRLVLSADPRDLRAYSGLAEALKAQAGALIGPSRPGAPVESGPRAEGREQRWERRDLF